MICETVNLRIERFTIEDVSFILSLLNDPMWISGIGDRNIRTIEGAENYLINGPFKLYDSYGYGPFKVILKDGNISIGMCGLIKRDSLPGPDLGFAFLSDYCGKGYGKESSQAILTFAKEEMKLDKLLAIVSPSNERSLRLIRSLNFKEIERKVLDGKETVFFEIDL